MQQDVCATYVIVVSFLNHNFASSLILIILQLIVIIMIIINNTPCVDILGTSLPVVFDVACTHKNQFFVCNITLKNKERSGYTRLRVHCIVISIAYNTAS